MTLRVTGLASGLDTESIISELVSVNSYKVASLQKAQTKLSWKTDAWKSMNTKVYGFYTSTLSDLRFSGSYSTRKTTVSDSSVATVTTSSKASNTVQSMRVDRMAKAGYLTGGQLDGSVKNDSKLSEINSSLAGQNGKINLKIGNGEAIELDITGETTVQDIVNQLKEHGLQEKQVYMSCHTILQIIRDYTRESGVRGLERQLATICRKSAREVLEKDKKRVRVDLHNLERYLGKPKYVRNLEDLQDEVGKVTGMAWTSVGGETLNIEVNHFPGKADLLLTGQMGDVMKESAQLGYSYIRSIGTQLGIDAEFFEKQSVHIHIPEGATPKDGPSAGISMATAVISAITGKIEAYNPNICILDFHDVSFMDSSGIAVVINALRCMAKIEGKLMLCDLGMQPMKVFQASGIDKLVRIKEEVK